MRICCAGEVMIELAARDGLYQRGVAGDSFNTAVYLARAGLAVSYLTRLGDDPASADILALLDREGIDTGSVVRCPGRRPGLYMIDNDADGERFFSYWRDNSPARELFDAPLELPGIDLFYFTGITLAVTREGIANLLTLLRDLHDRGCRIVFDPNYRPALWPGPEQARQDMARVLPLCHTVLPTLEDETALWGSDSIEACRDHYAGFGVQELVIKGPDLTTHALVEGIEVISRAEPVRAVDTTGAGDAYNAGYLAARLQGGDVEQAVHAAQALSAQVVQHRGAILPANED